MGQNYLKADIIQSVALAVAAARAVRTTHAMTNTVTDNPIGLCLQAGGLVKPRPGMGLALGWLDKHLLVGPFSNTTISVFGQTRTQHARTFYATASQRTLISFRSVRQVQ